MLRHARNELQFALEERWAHIGWELQRALSPVDIRAALGRIQGITCGSLEAFCLEYLRETTFHRLQATRTQFEEVSGKLREAHLNWTKYKETVRLAQLALRDASDEQTREKLRPFCQETEATLAQANRTLNQLQTRQNLLESALRQREASFAQSQLLDFIRSDRYSSTPMSFANAMAGLPLIHWRQSMDRCQKLKDGATNGVVYRRFQIVADVLMRSAANAEEAIEGMNARLIQAKGRDVATLNELAENWYFLRRAIESVFQAERPPKEALPYRVFAEYQRLMGCQSPLDVLLKEKKIIETPAYVKDRKRASTLGQRKSSLLSDTTEFGTPLRSRD